MWLLAILVMFSIFIDSAFAISKFFNRFIKKKHTKKDKADGILFVIAVLLNIFTSLFAILILFYYVLYFVFSLIGGIVF